MRQRDLPRILEIEAASFGPDAYDRKLFAEYARISPRLFLVAGARRVCGYSIARILAATIESPVGPEFMAPPEKAAA